MPPNLHGATSFVDATTAPLTSCQELANKREIPVEKNKVEEKPYQLEIVWRNVFLFIYMHGAFLYGIYLIVFQAPFITFAWAFFVGAMGGLGVTAGAHRLWSHRSYKATWQLRFLLAFLQTVALQNSIHEWVRDHRVHHKFSETNADPHNATRGFFFSHMGWLLCRKHPEVIRKGKSVDLSDLDEDPILVFQKKYYLALVPFLTFIIPVWVPWYFWNETLWNSWHIVGMFRYTLSLNLSWLVNSAAHHFMYGYKPYDKNITPTDSITVAISALGEGWHNFHHVFPWDYRSSELGETNMNLTTGFINLFARIGWAYDLKYASVDMVRRRAKRTGDGSYVERENLKKGKKQIEEEQEDKEDKIEYNIWGWGDKDMTVEDEKAALRKQL